MTDEEPPTCGSTGGRGTVDLSETLLAGGCTPNTREETLRMESQDDNPPYSVYPVD